jgi:hypothetical protein
MIPKITSGIVALYFSFLPALGQIINRNINNVRMDVINGTLSVRYDLRLKKNVPDCSIDLLFIDEHYNSFLPVSVSGEVGSGITAGNNKEVLWDYSKDKNLIQNRIRPVLVQNAGTYFKSHGRGPRNLFLSVIFPGLGDHRVADPGYMIFKPCFRSALSLGLIGAGIVALNNREKTAAYREYQPGFEKHPIFHPATVKYWAFPYDAEVFIGIGASIWIADILWVYTQGLINEKLSGCFRNNSLTFTVTPQSCYIGLSF